MKNVLIAMSLMVATSAGCSAAPSSANGFDNLSSGDSATAPDTYVKIRRDQRMCAWPICGGYFLKDVNSDTDEQYVSDLDFLTVDRSSVLANPLGELILKGHYGSIEPQSHTRQFEVVTARRGFGMCRWCGGDWLTTLNTSEPEAYVLSIDFSQSNLTSDQIDAAKRGNVILRGNTVPTTVDGETHNTLVVLEVYWRAGAFVGP